MTNQIKKAGSNPRHIAAHKGKEHGRRSESINARMTERDFDYFKSLNMSAGDFIRDAIEAHRSNKWENNGSDK